MIKYYWMFKYQHCALFEMLFFFWLIQHQLRQMEAQKRQQELILRRKNEEVRRSKSHTHGLEFSFSLFLNYYPLNYLHQVTALRRQVRPSSGKVNRKVSLPEPVQEPSHRTPAGRPQTSGSSVSNGARSDV